MQVSTAVLAAALTMFATQDMSQPASGGPVVLRDCQVTLIYDVEVPADLPAQQGGVLRNIAVTEGNHVKTGETLATVDNELEKMSEEVARYRLQMAQEEAGNDINVRYAQMAAGVHEYRLRQVLEALQSVPDAYTESEVKTYELQWKQFKLQTEQAQHEQNLAAMSVRVREAEHKLSEHELFRREIKAPVDGVVVKTLKKKGEWVRAGEPIARIIQLDRLRIGGLVKYATISPEDVDGKAVTVTVTLSKGVTDTFTGHIDFVSPELQGGDVFEVRAEVINRQDGEHWLLMPGMWATMEIRL